MNQDIAHLPPTPAQLAAYCGGTPDEYANPPEVSQVEFANIKRGRRSPNNSMIVPLSEVGRIIEEGEHLDFPYITCLDKTGRWYGASLSRIADNLFDLIVDGWVVYSYRAESLESV